MACWISRHTWLLSRKFDIETLILSNISTGKLKILRKSQKKTSYMFHKKWFIRVGNSSFPQFMGRNYHCQWLGWSVSCCKHCQIYFPIRRKNLYSFYKFLMTIYVFQWFYSKINAWSPNLSNITCEKY